MSNKTQETRKVPVTTVTDDHLEWMCQTAELNAGSGGASTWHKDVYSCLFELKSRREDSLGCTCSRA